MSKPALRFRVARRDVRHTETRKMDGGELPFRLNGWKAR